MATAKINAGICGFHTTVTVNKLDEDSLTVSFTSNCPHLQNIEPYTVDSMMEAISRITKTETFRILSVKLPHAACPVISGTMKAIEVESGMALPADVSIKVER